MGSEKAQERKIVFFCSASFDIDDKYNQAAREATRAACSLGYTVVSGGTVKGTMGVVADEVVRCGGRHVGIFPRFMEDVVYPSLDETVWTDTGIGTLDELIETLTLAKLDLYKGKIIALDFDGFYEPLKALLDHYVTTGMLDSRSRQLIAFPKTIEEFSGLLR